MGSWRHVMLFFNKLTMQKSTKHGVCMTNCYFWLQHLPVGGMQWLLVKPWTSSIGQCTWYCPTHRHDNRNGQQSGCKFLSLFSLLLPWRPLGQYGASSCLMAASSSFQYSPGHAALGNALCSIAPADHHGHQNSRQTKYIWSSSMISPSS